MQSARRSIRFPLSCLHFHWCNFPLQAGIYCGPLLWPTGKAWGTGQNNSGDDFWACCTAGKSSDLVKEMGGTHSETSSGNRRLPNGKLPKLLPSLGLPSIQNSPRDLVLPHSHFGTVPDGRANHECNAGAFPSKVVLRIGQPENQKKSFKALSYTSTATNICNTKELDRILLSLMEDAW